MSAAFKDGHHLIIYSDSCFSGHWALKAQQRSLRNVIVQTSCSDTETSLDGVFTKAFVDFQNSGGTAWPSIKQLCARNSCVYVPWSISDTVVFKDAHGKANRSRPYLHLLAEPQHVYRPQRTPAPAPAPAPPSVPSCAPAPAPVDDLLRSALVLESVEITLSEGDLNCFRRSCLFA
jgi:hypothetical protein